MANLSGLRHFLRDAVGLSQKEAADYTRAVRASGINNAEQETELVNHLSSKYRAALNGGTHDDVNISQEVYNALGAKNASGEGLGGKIWNAGQSPQIMNDSDVWDTTMKAMEGKTIGDLQRTYERFNRQKPVLRNDSDVWDAALEASEGGTIGDLESNYQRLVSTKEPSAYNPSNTPDSPKNVHQFKQSKHLDDFRVKTNPSSTEAPPAASSAPPSAESTYAPSMGVYLGDTAKSGQQLGDVTGSYLGNTAKTAGGLGDVSGTYMGETATKARSMGTYSPAPRGSVQSQVDAANPLGTQASREAEIAEAKARMAGQGEVTGSRKDGKGFFNSVKSSISNLKATAAEKINQATETVGGIKSSVTNKVGQAEEAIEGFKAKYSNTPTEFQQQTTEMVNKFAGGKYTGAVDTENMNWIEAGANKHLHKSVAQDYQNLMAKMQGAKDQEAFSKLMEETGINYKEGMSGAELEKNINAHFDKRIADGPGIANYMLGNRAASGAMLGVAGASVLALSDSRGRRSNSDLYSSQI